MSLRTPDGLIYFIGGAPQRNFTPQIMLVIFSFTKTKVGACRNRVSLSGVFVVQRCEIGSEKKKYITRCGGPER